jgi:hypothetical protein
MDELTSASLNSSQFVKHEETMCIVIGTEVEVCSRGLELKEVFKEINIK